MNDTDTAPSLSTATMIRFLLDAFAAKSLKFLTMALAFVLCGAVAFRPHWTTLTAAALYIALVAPLWYRRERSNG